MIEFVYQCSTCGKCYRRNEVRYLCPDCARRTGPACHSSVSWLRIRLAASGSDSAKPPDWNLFSAVEPKFFPPFPVGGTPFFQVGGARATLGFDNIWLKNDGLNPSGSLKDRASFLVVAEANAQRGNHRHRFDRQCRQRLAAVCAAAGNRR